MSEELYTGENYKSGYIVQADYTNAVFPDDNYQKGKVKFNMYVENLHTGLLGGWIEQPVVIRPETLRRYLPSKWNLCYNCLPLIHMIFRDAFGQPYIIWDGYQIHHPIPVNGLLALIYADRVETPMTPEGQFCSELREFFKIDSEWLDGMGLLIPLDKSVHSYISDLQRGRDYTTDIYMNIDIRCNKRNKYPENEYYRFENGESIVNLNHCYGIPRFSKCDRW